MVGREGIRSAHLPGGDLPSDLRLPPLYAAAETHALPAAGPGVVYFFAPWCFYCRHSIGHIDELVRAEARHRCEL